MSLRSPVCRSALIAGAALIIVSACAVGVGGYGDGGGYAGADVGYVGGYYEPYGYEYGGWGHGYRVGPPRGGVGHVGGAGPPRGRPPGGARPAPSIPGRPRRCAGGGREARDWIEPRGWRRIRPRCRREKFSRPTSNGPRK
jgi:hypothetical protein